jgi:hypothetical protein
VCAQLRIHKQGLVRPLATRQSHLRLKLWAADSTASAAQKFGVRGQCELSGAGAARILKASEQFCNGLVERPSQGGDRVQARFGATLFEFQKRALCNAAMYGKVSEAPATRLPQAPDSLTESDLQRGGCRPCHRTDSAVQCLASVPLLRYGVRGRILDLRLCLRGGFW